MELFCKLFLAVYIWIPVLVRAVSDQGDWYTRELDRHHYFFSWTKEHWTNAQRTCRDMGGDLVTINTYGENNFVESLPERSYHWIGLYGNCTRTSCSNFRWSNGDEVTFKDWYSSQPQSAASSNYVRKTFPTGEWYNRPDENYYNFVCEFEDDCFPNNPCSADFVCQSEFTGGHTCITLSQVDECQSNPCVNGECQDHLGNYTCVCEPGYEGINCENDINECQKEGPCIFGSCTNNAGSFSCTCKAGFYGDLCQYDIDECVNHNCVNGDCIDGIDEYLCACYSGYTGTFCEQQVSECNDAELCVRYNMGPHTSTVIAISAAMLALLVVTVTLLVIHLLVATRKKHGTPGNSTTSTYNATSNGIPQRNITRFANGFANSSPDNLRGSKRPDSWY